MTFQIIHDRGRSFVVETRARIYTEPKPRLPQKPRYTRPEWKHVEPLLDHNGYRPGKIFELGADQCRFVIKDDHTMCGQKQHKGSSYCPHHWRKTVDPRYYDTQDGE
jgi:hypothetical protein